MSGSFRVADMPSKYSRTSMGRTPLEPSNIFETGVVRANEC